MQHLLSHLCLSKVANGCDLISTLQKLTCLKRKNKKQCDQSFRIDLGPSTIENRFQNAQQA
ncbi:hypothetical protein HZS_6724 [Henneguya salminicola]|nr:hypothetical protein HZS_6724 [Henneguya salminicola]